MQAFKLKVSNVKCGGCVANIQNGLGEISGVSHVEVDIPSGEVSFQSVQTDLDVIKQKLSSLGYPPVD